MEFTLSLINLLSPNSVPSFLDERSLIMPSLSRSFTFLKYTRGIFGEMVFKIELEAFYDPLENSFILQSHILQKKFPNSIISLIMACINTSSLSSLINGIPTSYFLNSRGIRQVDPYLHICSLYTWSFSLDL